MLLFGGSPGIGDAGLLESALVQPQNVHLYSPQADLFDIAAAYAFHLAKNHPFNDGNKRTALQAALSFLVINGLQTVVSQDVLYEAMIRLTIGAWSKDEFAEFLRSHAN